MSLLRLARSLRGARAVQRFLRELPYNREEGGETLRSAERALKVGKAHCLEAAFVAARLMEFRGFEPLVMSLESQDNLDHVVFVFKSAGRWGSIARSRDEGLHGRPAIFRSLRDLALSYVEPYVDLTGRITGFGLANLDDSCSPWRDSAKNVWKAERYLIDLKHERLRTSDRRYRELLARYKQHKSQPRKPWWW